MGSNRNRWTPEQDELLRASYPRDREFPPILLEKHTLYSIYYRAHYLGLTVEGRKRCTPGIKERLTTLLSPVEVAYLAGIFDGEGWITSVKGKHTTTYSEVGVGSITVALMEWLLAHIPGSVFRPRHTPEGLHQQYEWKLRGQLRVHDFLSLVLPHLIVKKDKAEQTVAYIREKYPHYLQ